MSERSMPVRRDPRYDLEPGSAFLELADPRAGHERVRAELTRISAAGVCFESAAWGREIPVGAVLVDVALEIGERRLAGEVHVLNAQPKDGRVVFGGVFHPSTPEVEDVLMELLEGIGAAVRTEGGP
jgi:hypothetical protein